MIRVPLDAWCGLVDVLGVRDGLGVADDAGVVDGGLVRRSSAEDVDASPDAHAALRAHTRTTTGRTRLRVAPRVLRCSVTAPVTHREADSTDAASVSIVARSVT
jgi:hypothetical protein